MAEIIPRPLDKAVESLNSKFDRSTTAKSIGKWHDGSTLYEVSGTYEGTINNDGTTDTTIATIASGKTVVRMDVVLGRSASNGFSTTPSQYFKAMYEKETGNINVTQSFSSYADRVYWTVQYI